MASYDRQAVRSPVRELIPLTTTFATQGTNAPTLPTGARVDGASYISLARTNTGLYTITTLDPYPHLQSVSVQISLATPVAMTAITGAASQNATTGVWTIPLSLFNQAGTATDIAAATGNALSITLWVCNV